MAEPQRSRDGLDAAARRLDTALDALETALSRRRAGERSIAALHGELQLLAEERARLARQLNEARDHTAALESANREASRRLDAAMAAIRMVLETEGS
ncbi:MAG: DUF4164 domain-containing protein [Pseudomonadota bacterium]|nr:DUF4164 domain-containing protein [Pseudomonadota bacterium]